MQRLTTWLVALALALSGAVAPAQLAMTGAGSKPAGGGGGGGSVAYDTSEGATGEDQTTMTTASATVASTSNRYAIGALAKNQNAGITFSSSSLFGASGTFITSQGDVGTFGHYRVSEALAPSSGSQTASVTYSALTSFAWMAAAVYNGVNQTTPKNSTATPVTGALPLTTNAVAITITTVTGGKAVALLYVSNANANGVSLACSNGTIRREADYLFLAVFIIDRDHQSGGSTAINCDVTLSAVDSGDYVLLGYGVQP